MEIAVDNPADLKEGWSVIYPESDVESLALYGDYIWAGGRDGVYKIERESGNPAGEIDCDFDISYVASLLTDKDGFLWIGFNGGALRYDGKDCILFTTENGLLDNRVNAIYQDDKGRILIGTWGGVSILDDNKWSYVTSENGLLEDMVNVIYGDQDGGLWFGSYVAPRGGVSLLKDGNWEYFTASDFLPHNNINAITGDRGGGVWIGTGLYDRGGAVRLVYDGNNWDADLKLSKKDGLAGEKVRSLYEDKMGNLWFGSEYDGLTLQKDNTFKVLSEKDGLSDSEIKCFLMDSDYNLWIGTYSGITRISASALDEI